MTNTQSAPCVECGGTGFVVTERDGVSRARICSCRQRTSRPDRIQVLLEAARIPNRYRECEFANFDAHGAHAISLLEAKTLAERYAREYPLSDRGLLFMGSPGVGKTHLAVATLRQLALEKGVGASFFDVQDLLRQLQGTFDRQSGMSQLDLLQPVVTMEVVVLDDLGGRQLTPWVEETLTHIVTTRYNDRKATIVTTNYLDEPDDPRTPTLQDRIGVRVRSRLHEMCQVVLLQAADFRSEIKRADHHSRSHRIGRPKDRS